MKNLMQFLAFFLFLICFLPAEAQRYSNRKKVVNRFAASAVLGVNFSQMDGDLSFGFKKKGIYGGLRASTIFTKKLRLNLELLYSQKGSELERQGRIFLEQKEVIRANYMEIPILLKTYLKKENNGPFVEVGFSYARLINASVHEEISDTTRQIAFSEIAPNFQKNEFSLVGGLGIDFHDHYMLGARITVALTPLYQDPDYQLPVEAPVGEDPVFRLQMFFISIYSGYRF